MLATMLRELLPSLLYPREIYSLFKMKFRSYNVASTSSKAQEDDDLEFCYTLLNKVSRSFAYVIQQLPLSLRNSVAIFYLILRGLDSIEDDMNLDNELKIDLLQHFFEKLQCDAWFIEHVGDSEDHRLLLSHFYKVIRVFKTSQPSYQNIITTIIRKMGKGMAEFVHVLTNKNKSMCIDTVKNYDLYCHYVAGLVGEGLSQLFVESGLETASVAQDKCLWNSVGLFLQKTNIIGDYFEDCHLTGGGRRWWPKEIWSKYGVHRLEDFTLKPDAPESLSCLNAMINDALRHVPDCLHYLSRLENERIFIFCAIPQTRAMATLLEFYNNPQVYRRKNVQVRKGLAALTMLDSSNFGNVKYTFRKFALQMSDKVVKNARHCVDETRRQ
ncbi:unnamed protein product, partial [Didymodactylos carnosus]